jgi:hypothetical protein
MEHDEGLTRDIALVNRIHSQLPAAVLMVDANDGYSVEDALAFLEGIEGCDLYWFEEPFRENEDNNRKLKITLGCAGPVRSSQMANHKRISRCFAHLRKSACSTYGNQTFAVMDSRSGAD